MSVLTRLAAAEVRHRPSRFVAVLLAIVIGATFATATAVFTATAVKAAEAAIAAPLLRSDLVVVPTSGEPDSDRLERLMQTVGDTEGVVAAAPSLVAIYSVDGAEVRVLSAVGEPRLTYQPLLSGAWPAADDQIVVPADFATSQHLAIGDRITLNDPYGDPQSSTSHELIVTGISEAVQGTAAQDPTPMLWSTASFAAGSEVAWLVNVLVATDEPATTAASLRAALGTGYQIQTAQEAIDNAVAGISRDAVPFTVVLATFAIVALAVAAIVIANTFRIVVEQRRSQIALQRLVGVSSAGVRRQVLVEGLFLGLLGTALGLACGIGVGYLATSVLGSLRAGLVVPPAGLAMVAAASLLITLAAIWLPAQRACRVAPIEATRPTATVESTGQRSGHRVIAGLSVAAAGTAVMVGAALRHDLGLATAGGLISLLGVLLLAPAITAGLARVVAPLGSLAGEPGRLAARDLTRHLGRASNTVVALIVGVCLITTLRVGAATMTATATAQMADSPQRASMESVMAGLTTVATVLLAVSAVIAVVGVANTLTLSVLERRRETALLRIHGLTRRDAAVMVAVEAVLLAIIGTVTGIVLGTAYGLTAAYTVVGRYPLVIEVPWLTLAAVAALTLVAALIAAVLPALRSSRVRLLTAAA